MYKSKWKLEIKGRGIAPTQMLNRALSFLRTCEDCPRILTLVAREGRDTCHRRVFCLFPWWLLMLA